jgi:hypothetical protein
MPRQRMPKGVVLLAIIYFLVAISLLLIGSLFAMAPVALQSFGFRPNPDASVRLSGLGFFAGTGAIAGAVGYGLWRLKRWAHLVVICSTGPPLIRGVMTLLRSVLRHSTPNAHVNLAAFILAVAALWYLWTPGVRAAFGLQRSPPTGNEQP